MRTLERGVRFTERQRQVIQLIAEGCSNEEIAGRLGVSRRRYIPLAYRSVTGQDPMGLGLAACERAIPDSPR